MHPQKDICNNMLKPYYKRAEQVNFLLEEGNPLSNEEIDIPYLDTKPNVFNVDEIVLENNFSETLDANEIDQLKNELCKYQDCIPNTPGKTNLVVRDIELNSDQPVLSKPYRNYLRQNDILKIEIQKMLAMKIINWVFLTI
ncbi:hypothetical protein AVEN_117376-1 [Araneus ventricosus]|uniref:Uncharacterized protein n=1 Tax=Araneus ventricosus TaxID=182803 RepID=A0A4Y2E383_ARAVE|nr:hypothetical protein AVEN_117376-1 [Araneus ventricosus]